MNRAKAPNSVSDIFAIALPTIAANLLLVLVGLVDTKAAAHFGPEAVAAVTAGSRLAFVLQAVLMAITAGSTALITRAWGAGDRQRAKELVTSSLAGCVGLGLVAMLIGACFARPVVRVFGLPDGATDHAASFVAWSSPGYLALAVHQALGAASRSAGDARTPLWIGALTNVINVLLVLLLAFGALGVPTLGVRGIALASAAAYAAGAVLFCALWLSDRLVLPPAFSRSRMWPQITQIFRIGYPAAIEQSVWQAGIIVLLLAVANYGEVTFAAYGISVTVITLCAVVGLGFSVATSVVVGQQLGAGRADMAVAATWRALRYAVASMICLGLAIAAGAEWISSLIVDDPEVQASSVVALRVLALLQPLMGVEVTLAGALRGAGDTRTPLYASLSGVVLARVILAHALVRAGAPVVLVYASLGIDYVIKVAVLLVRFRSDQWSAAIGRHAA